MLPDPIVSIYGADTTGSYTTGTSTSFSRVRTSGNTTEYVATNGIASATQPMFLRITQKKRQYGVQGPVRYTVDVEYHIDVAAVNGVPQADRPIKFSYTVEGNSFDLTTTNVNRIFNIASGIFVAHNAALMAGQS